ncbi:hypothetical protein FBY35_0136 [Streptomyces sp. SLBN-118]|nr:hypothetical protein FBY35_0136 [Streptomyces sp. SLBN-118]
MPTDVPAQAQPLQRPEAPLAAIIRMQRFTARGREALHLLFRVVTELNDDLALMVRPPQFEPPGKFVQPRTEALGGTYRSVGHPLRTLDGDRAHRRPNVVVKSLSLRYPLLRPVHVQVGDVQDVHQSQSCVALH